MIEVLGDLLKITEHDVKQRRTLQHREPADFAKALSKIDPEIKIRVRYSAKSWSGSWEDRFGGMAASL